MRLADSSVRKRNAEEEYGEDGLCFCSARDAVAEILPRSAGKILFAADSVSFPVFAAFGRNPRVLAVVEEEDALPLFSMPDGVGAVVAAGGEKLLRAARFFARIRRIPCYLFPRFADLRGVYEGEGQVRLGRKSAPMPLADGEVFFDKRLLRDSLGDGYSALLLSRLAGFESRALRALGGKAESVPEKACALPCDYAGIVAENAANRCAEAAGTPAGEGAALAELYRGDGAELPCWRAYRALTAVYHAFFKRGVPRRYFVPDYALRAERAGVPRWTVGVPSREEYALRAMALERTRAAFLAETSAEVAELPVHRRAVFALTGKEPPAGDGSLLALLPERRPDGLCAVIRDFGLL